MSRHIALIHRGKTGSWGISFPDFPGCISAADRSSFPDIVDRGAEALRFHVEGLRDAGTVIPEPRAIEDLRADPEFADDFADAIVTLVPLLPPRAKPLRINISMDSNLLLEIDAKAEQLGMNRSEFLAEAARSCILAGVKSGNVLEGTSAAVRIVGKHAVRDVILEERPVRDTDLTGLSNFKRAARDVDTSAGHDPRPPRDLPKGHRPGDRVLPGLTKGTKKHR